jgi:hypothetical protein
VLTRKQWQQRLAEDEIRARRDRELEARTADSAGIGNAEIEKAHHLKGE